MKYTAEVTLKGTIEVEADSLEEARTILEDGFSASQFHCEDSDVDDVYSSTRLSD